MASSGDEQEKTLGRWERTGDGDHAGRRVCLEGEPRGIKETRG